MSQRSEVIHDEEEGKEIIKYPFHSLSFPILHEGNSSVHVTHDICLVYPSLHVHLEEPYYLSKIFVEDAQIDQISDIDGLHPYNSDIVAINNSSCPHTIHDMIRYLESNSTILQGFRSC